ncbi:G-type lectin S-receptor-like serine/threonine-protein kinase RLK1 [Panicum miliaceum]|uniref:non-specific serine/threonine protein kinase n=1 Tax=Panicum miliaceum TaxID=4540 RepID=A0A3L6PWC8_PANMI|nr:G-type lectin S-receptor-like serine/threonine-protein kinase RLK1 [Panicum miliaceum]
MAPLLLLPLLLLLSSVSLQAQQNITLGSSLTPEGPSSYWLSPSGDFAFGFRPIEGNTSSYLLAVWFNKINDKTVAWYARTSSPEPSPVPVSSGSRLQLTSGGTLSLLNHTNSEVWTPQFVGAAAYARMLDSGNFVLAAADGSTKWGTFNNPADTILLTQELNAPNTLYSRIITTDYSNGRFLLNLKNTVTKKTVPYFQSTSNLGLPLKAFTYAELEKATNGFQEILGTGASGIVYKSQLLDDLGTYIAVKKIDKLEQESEKEFTVEVQAIGRTHHKNLVRLLGLCNEGKERLLVYEFMSNGSLSIFRFGDVKLQWNLRVQLAAGPQNILLDDNFTANISDFGLAKLLRTNQTQTNTGIRGTRGYVAPEWFKSIGIAAKVDVYSFGVILLELICCRRNVELEAEEEHQKILTYWANDCYRCGSVDFLVKGDDEANCNLKVVERFVAVALWCLQEDPAMRPTMLKVTQMLDGVAAIPTPVDPSSFGCYHAFIAR